MTSWRGGRSGDTPGLPTQSLLTVAAAEIPQRHAWQHTHTHTHTHTHANTYTHTYMYPYAHKHTCSFMQIHTHKTDRDTGHTHTTYTHTQNAHSDTPIYVHTTQPHSHSWESSCPPLSILVECVFVRVGQPFCGACQLCVGLRIRAGSLMLLPSATALHLQTVGHSRGP